MRRTKIYSIILFVLATAICAFVLELIAFFSLPVAERRPILYKNSISIDPFNGFKSLQDIEFDIIDPLLGWRMSDSILHKKGFYTENGNIVFHGKCKCYDTLVVYLSGGSTTDPAVIPHNWPTLLSQLFDSAKICSKIIIGAVGGFNSGQELLKLISNDLIFFRPDIHLSYSGANQIEPAYVSIYEQEMYLNLPKPSPPPYFANAWLLLRKLIYKDKFFEQVKINDYYREIRSNYLSGRYEKNYSEKVRKFWLNNMKTMQALAHLHGYTFIGVLQPVQGAGNYRQQNYESYILDMINQYKSYYPLLAQECKIHPEFIYDMKNLFDQINDTVYTDDCHIYPQFQGMVARSVFDLITNRNRVQISDSMKCM
ncbi:MAG: hypothetical protein RMJ53_08910 [Chitinophagales bacterium]|nr:hypothetical protein [Chitinophagales bacterium]MDW8274332.1 hypothetical protein [Chitinophagales bacterium]